MYAPDDIVLDFLSRERYPHGVASIIYPIAGGIEREGSGSDGRRFYRNSNVCMCVWDSPGAEPDFDFAVLGAESLGGLVSIYRERVARALCIYVCVCVCLVMDRSTSGY